MKQSYEQRVRALAETMCRDEAGIKKDSGINKVDWALFGERYMQYARIAVAEMAEAVRNAFRRVRHWVSVTDEWIEIYLKDKGLIPDNGQGVGRKIVTLTCENCGTKWQGEEPKMCCNGTDCGCMGLPVDGPICCDEKCFNELMVKLNQNNGQEAGSDDTK